MLEEVSEYFRRKCSRSARGVVKDCQRECPSSAERVSEESQRECLRSVRGSRSMPEGVLKDCHKKYQRSARGNVRRVLGETFEICS